MKKERRMIIIENIASIPFALDEKRNYVYIADANRTDRYFCPCCGKKLIPAAIESNLEWQVPPYFRHDKDCKCDSESIAHWVYTVWLFEKGSKFKVLHKGKMHSYQVKTIEINKSHKILDGLYRPDMTIYTECNEVFYFEINFSNPKDENDYFRKWNELGNDVIEVDVKDLLQNSRTDRIPVFKLLYSNGECFKKSYICKDEYARTIDKRKQEIKRQDKLNYLIRWERLDWFWIELQKYKRQKLGETEIFEIFSAIDFYDKETCFNIINNSKCFSKEYIQNLRDIINTEFELLFFKFVEDTKQKLLGIATEEKYMKCWCTVKEGFGLYFTINDEYCLFDNKINITYSHYTRKWILEPSTLYELIGFVNNKILMLPLHIVNLNKIKSYISNDMVFYKYPLLFTNLKYSTNEPVIKLNELYVKSNEFLIDYESIIQEVKDNYTTLAIKYLADYKNDFQSNFFDNILALLNKEYNFFYFDKRNYFNSSSTYIRVKEERYSNKVLYNFIFNEDKKILYLDINSNDYIPFDLESSDFEIAKRFILSRSNTYLWSEHNKLRNEKEIEMIQREERNNIIDKTNFYNIVEQLNNDILKDNHIICSLEIWSTSQIDINFIDEISKKDIYNQKINIDDFDFMITNNYIYGYLYTLINQIISQDCFVERKNKLDFILSISDYSNNQWRFKQNVIAQSYDKRIDIQFIFKNPLGYEKISYSSIQLNEFLRNESYTLRDLKLCLAVYMNELIEKQVKFYNGKQYGDKIFYVCRRSETCQNN